LLLLDIAGASPLRKGLKSYLVIEFLVMNVLELKIGDCLVIWRKKVNLFE